MERSRFAISIKLSEREFIPGGLPRKPRERVLSEVDITTLTLTEDGAKKRYEDLLTRIFQVLEEDERFHGIG